MSENASDFLQTGIFTFLAGGWVAVELVVGGIGTKASTSALA